jgi:phosphate transport system permease protein
MSERPSRSRHLLPPRAADRLATFATWLVALGGTSVFVWLLTDIAGRGIERFSPGFLVESPLDAGRSGGIGPILLSTGLIVGVALAVAAPIGLGTSVFLAEFVPKGSRSESLIGCSLDVLAGIPSIVFGLFGNAFFCVYLGLGFSILSGGLTLACMVLPILIRTVEAGLRSVPGHYRLSAAALGLSQTSSLIHLLLPAAAPSLIAGLMLGVGRAMAETAALIFTSGYVDRAPGSILDSGRSLSVHVYDLSMNVAGGDSTAAASALVLVGVLLVFNYLARSLVTFWQNSKIMSA